MYDFVADTWFVLVIDGRFAIAIDAVVDIYPVKSAEVFTTLADIPVGDEVEVATKLLHFTVYVRFVLTWSISGQNSNLLNPWEVSTAAQSWLNSVDPATLY